MSSRKRRIKRKIQMLTKMDATYFRINRSGRYWNTQECLGYIACMQAMAEKLTRMGLRTRGLAALDAGRRQRRQYLP